MPYKLSGNKVVKADSGELVKDHGDDHDKAVRHLRALKANVEEAVLCECGARAVNEYVCQRGHRLEETWSPEARAAAALARKDHPSDRAVAAGATHVHLSPIMSGPARNGEAGRNWSVKGYVKPGGVEAAQTTAMIGDRIEPIDKLKSDYAHMGGNTFRGPVTGSFKARPPQALRQRGQ